MRAPTYLERLWAPVSYWIIALAFGLTVVVALGFYLGPWVALVTTLITTALIAGALLWYGSTRLEVGESLLRVADMRIGYGDIGEARPLDAEQARLLFGRDANAAAKLVERPYIKTAVQIPITDPADPHPYWLVSSRRPERFAAALNERRAQA